MSEIGFGFPNMKVDPKVKAEKAYGLDFARAIFSRHGENYSTTFDERRRFRLLRKYAEGMQSVNKYKGLLDLDGDTSYANIDWTPPAIMPKFIDILVDKFLGLDYDFECDPIDPMAKDAMSDVMEVLKRNMMIAPAMEQLAQASGQENPLKGQPVPKNEDDLEVWLNMTSKIGESIAIEEAIKAVLNSNDWQQIKTQVIRDLIVLKKAGIRPYYDSNNAIRLDYIDPVETVTSWTDKPDFRNIQYFGIFSNVSIAQLADMSNGELSEDQLYEIARINSNKQGNPAWKWGNAYYPQNAIMTRPYDNFMVRLLDFSFLSLDVKKWSEKSTDGGGVYFQERGFNYAAPEHAKNKSTVHEKTIQNVYCGTFVIGTQIVINYGLQKNMVRPREKNRLTAKTYLPIIMFAPNIYDMENKSLAERMIPFADQIALAHFKIQQLIGKAIPPGVKIDQRGLESIVNGMGQGNMTPKDIYEMYAQTGNFLYRSKDVDGDIINSSVIDQLPNGVSPGIVLLANEIERNISMIRNVTGLNEAVDSSTPNKDALIGVQKMAAAASNAAVRHIKDGYENICTRTGNMLALMIQGLFEEGHGEELFMQSLGKGAVEFLNNSELFSLMDAGIKMVYRPTIEERAELNTNIQIAMAAGDIRLEDSIMIKEFDSVKMANQYLIYRKKVYAKEKQAEAAANSQMNGQIQQQSLQMASQAELQKLQMEAEIKAKMKQEEIQLEMMRDAQLHKFKMEEIELSGNLAIHQDQLSSPQELERYKIDQDNATKIHLEEMKLYSKLGEKE